ncbi:hypothetical protein V2J09_010748, partial [Rumex salicifolius]
GSPSSSTPQFRSPSSSLSSPSSTFLLRANIRRKFEPPLISPPLATCYADYREIGECKFT